MECQGSGGGGGGVRRGGGGGEAGGGGGELQNRIKRMKEGDSRMNYIYRYNNNLKKSKKSNKV